MPRHPSHLEVPRDIGPNEYSMAKEKMGNIPKKLSSRPCHYFPRKCFQHKSAGRKDGVLKSISGFPSFSQDYYLSTQFSACNLGDGGKNKGILQTSQSRNLQDLDWSAG